MQYVYIKKDGQFYKNHLFLFTYKCYNYLNIVLYRGGFYMETKTPYEKPEVKVVEFVIEDSIAESGNGALQGESIWGS